MATIQSVKLFASLLISMSLTGVSVASEKQRIEKETDLPRFSYKLSEPLEKIVKDKALFAKTTVKIRSDIESVLDKYEIADKASHRQYLETLMLLDFLLGNYDQALVSSEKVRALEE
jgi:hypothetical protein